MGHWGSCTNWDYEDHPNRSRVTRRSKRLERLVQKHPKRFARYGLDTRPGHKFMFYGMTPESCPELVGSYRGSPTPSLANYSVGVPSDDKVGTPPGFVAFAMTEFERRCELVTAQYHDTTATQPRAVRLVRLVAALCGLLEEFFRIHPYANGNGHTGRLMMLVLMVRQGFNPVRWHIDDSPAYHDAIRAYRRGKEKDLQRFLLKAIAGP